MKRIWEKIVDCCFDCPYVNQGVDRFGHRNETTDHLLRCGHEKSAGMVTRYWTLTAGCHPKCPLKKHKEIK